MLPYVNQGLMDYVRKQMSDDQSSPSSSPHNSDGRLYSQHCSRPLSHHYYIRFVCGQWNPKNPGRPVSIIAFSITPGPGATD